MEFARVTLTSNLKLGKSFVAGQVAPGDEIPGALYF